MPSKPKTLWLPPVCDEEDVAAQKGKYVDGRYYSTLVAGEPTNVLRPDGSPLLIYRPQVSSAADCELARPSLRRVARMPNDHRNYKWTEVMGNFNCRQTAFTANQLRRWLACIPLIRAVNRVFRHELPARYSIQRKIARSTVRDWAIADTAFSTVTVNRWDGTHDARTPVHKDKYDLPEGFGCMTVLRKGNYSGGYLCFPRYDVAVDLHTRDILLFDPHEWHANIDIVGQPGWERLSCIFYYQTRLQQCGQSR